MKTINQFIITLTGASALTFAMLFSAPAHAGGNGTDILHLSFLNLMGNQGIEPGAEGALRASQNKQGNANNQKMEIAVLNLTSNTTYEIVAAIDSDTNFTQIAPLTTDSTGAASVKYASLGNGHGGGHGSTALPLALNPVSLIRKVGIFNSSTQAVLVANVDQPIQLQYLVKRNLSTGNIKSTLQLKATTSQVQFRLTSTGLTPSSKYFLIFNGDMVQTNTADASGKLTITRMSQTGAGILDLRSVQVWDSSSNVVLQTQLP